MNASLILDGVVAALLVATIAYCVILNRRLGALRRDKDDLRQVVASFNEATVRAEAGIARLKQTGEAISEALQEQMEEAQARYDELVFVTDRADKLASTLGSSISAARSASGPRRAEGGEGGTKETGGGKSSDLSRAERELLGILESAR
jgi:hypothetical protein